MISETEVQNRMKRFKQVAREHGLKLTHQRLEIYREVAKSEEHPSAESILKAVQKRIPTVSHDTVYRTLWSLTEIGLLTTLGPRQKGVRFDANPKVHHHFVCTRCGMVRDFESAALNALPMPEIVSELGSYERTQVEALGICQACLEKS